MSSKQNIGKIIRDQRKSIHLTLAQLSEISGVSLTHLGRIEQGQRRPSSHTLQKIAKPLSFGVNKLLILAGYLSPESSPLSQEERQKICSELNMLLKRVVSDSNRIKEIINRLLMTS